MKAKNTNYGKFNLKIIESAFGVVGESERQGHEGRKFGSTRLEDTKVDTALKSIRNSFKYE